MTGDGAGIMTEIPFEFFANHVDIDLPAEGHYAVGLFLLMNLLQGQSMKSNSMHILLKKA